ncbi:MAG: hypothetical protein LV481_01630 [Methylacidiphilales bacterium]|nr:hypothetical protein [Candidatus Methylacidiphilales bacterium]
MKTGIVSLMALMSFGCAHADSAIPGDHFFTKALPEPDRAQVILSNTSKNIAAVLLGKDARYLASLVREQTVGDFGMRCNNPQYTLWFFRSGKLIASETICFQCHWIWPINSDMHVVSSPEGFDISTPQAAELAAYLKKIAPPE